MATRILVVDDDQMNLMRAKMILSKGNYEVLQAESGEDALKILEEEAVELVLLDIEMPGMNGITTLEKLRAMEQGANLPVLFMTGTYGVEEQAQGERLGVKGCVQKPFLPKVILEQVGEIVN